MSVFSTMDKCNQFSPVVGDVQRVVSYDEDGNEIITFVPVDYSQISAANGPAEMWSIGAMLKAGINPKEAGRVHTGLNTRLEGADYVNSVEAMLDAEMANSQPADEK